MTATKVTGAEDLEPFLGKWVGIVSESGTQMRGLVVRYVGSRWSLGFVDPLGGWVVKAFLPGDHVSLASDD